MSSQTSGMMLLLTVLTIIGITLGTFGTSKLDDVITIAISGTAATLAISLLKMRRKKA